MKPILELIRLEEDAISGTFGVLRIQKELFCVTLEPSDLLNLKGRSSIPAQQYDCLRYLSPRFGETFIVTDVPDRTDVLFHPGNKVIDTEGCILLGQYPSKLKGDRAVLNSGETFKAFMALMKGHSAIHLTIREVY